MSKNCPFCPPDSQYEAWGFGPVGWQGAKENHDRGHTGVITSSGTSPMGTVERLNVCQHEWHAIAAPLRQCSKCQMMQYF